MSWTRAFARETPVTAKMIATGSWKARRQSRRGGGRDPLERPDVHAVEEDRDDERRDDEGQLPAELTRGAARDGEEVTDEPRGAADRMARGGTGGRPRRRRRGRRRSSRAASCSGVGIGVVGGVGVRGRPRRGGGRTGDPGTGHLEEHVVQRRSTERELGHANVGDLVEGDGDPGTAAGPSDTTAVSSSPACGRSRRRGATRAPCGRPRRRPRSARRPHRVRSRA